MAKKKSAKSKSTIPKPTAALTASNLPKPRRVSKGQVGDAVQDFIDFGGAKAVETHEESGGTWLVTATA
jgi:hypothetical protein